MLEYLKATNFQVFENLFVEFHPGLNVIIAPTDSGKSSIIRLLDWIFTNHQLRYNYQNDNSKTKRNAKVIGEIGLDGRVVKRVKGGADNYYELDGNQLKAIGNAVPDPLKELFNMDSINIHRQHSKHFLLGETSGDVGKFINGIVNLDVLSEAPKYAEAKVKAFRKETNEKQRELDEIQQQLKSYDWIDPLDEKVERLLKKELIINAKQQELDELEKLFVQYDSLEEELREYDGLSELNVRTRKLLMFSSDVERLEQEHNELDDLVEQYYELKQQLDSYKDFDGVDAAVKRLSKEIETINRMQDEFDELDKAIEVYYDLKQDHDKLSEQCDSLKEEFDELMPEKCPLCGK